jgi:hypothetical protein
MAYDESWQQNRATPVTKNVLAVSSMATVNNSSRGTGNLIGLTSASNPFFPYAGPLQRRSNYFPPFHGSTCLPVGDFSLRKIAKSGLPYLS